MIVFVPKRKLYSEEYFKSGQDLLYSLSSQSFQTLSPNLPVLFVPKRKFSTKEVGISISNPTNSLGKGF